jgi:hypothetical protein
VFGRGHHTLEADAALLGHLALRLEDMTGSGLVIPLCYEHQLFARGEPVLSSSWPEWLAENREQLAGHVDSPELTAGGILEVQCHVDDLDTEKVRGLWVSPQFMPDYEDPRGGIWPGLSIEHLALTVNPVIWPQGRFRELRDERHLTNGRLLVAPGA